MWGLFFGGTPVMEQPSQGGPPGTILVVFSMTDEAFAIHETFQITSVTWASQFLYLCFNFAFAVSINFWLLFYVPFDFMSSFVF